MSKKIKVEDLAGTVEVMLNEYAASTADVVKESVSKAGKDAVNDLKRTSPKLTGKYAKSWNAKKTHESSHDMSVVVHNKKYYGLTHLLEHGHALRNGGRTREFPHIAPEAKKITKQVEEDIKKGISNV